MKEKPKDRKEEIDETKFQTAYATLRKLLSEKMSSFTLSQAK